MSRVDVIKALVGRKVGSAPSKPRGLAHPGETVKPVRRQHISGKGYFAHESMGFVRDMRVKGFMAGAPKAVGPARKEAVFKESERHGPHALTRIAEKWAKRHA